MEPAVESPVAIPQEPVSMEQQLQDYLRERLFADKAEDVGQARNSAALEEFTNRIRSGGGTFLENMGGIKSNRIPSTSEAQKLAELLKEQAGSTALKDKLAMQAMTPEQAAKENRQQRGQVVGGSTKYAGSPVEYSSSKGYFFIHEGKPVYSDTQDKEAQQAFKDFTRRGVGLDPERKRIMEGNLAGDISKTQTLSPKDVDRVQELKGYRDDLIEVDNLLSGVPFTTGKWKNLWEDAKEWVPGAEQDPEFSKARTLLGKTLVNFMRAASGVAISAQEADRLMKLLPNVTQKPEQLQDNLAEWRRDVADKIQNFLESKAEAGKDVTEVAKTMQELGYYTPSARFLELQANIIPKGQLKDKQRAAVGLPKVTKVDKQPEVSEPKPEETYKFNNKVYTRAQLEVLRERAAQQADAGNEQAKKALAAIDKELK
jgi:hypothetical protein